MELKNKISIALAISLFILVVIPLHSHARLIVTTQITVGEIVTIQGNQIELLNGSTYFPANEKEKLAFQVGDLVTVEFYTNPEYINFYLNIALGENTLTPSPEPERTSEQTLY